MQVTPSSYNAVSTNLAVVNRCNSHGSKSPCSSTTQGALTRFSFRTTVKCNKWFIAEQWRAAHLGLSWLYSDTCCSRYVPSLFQTKS